MYRKSRSGVLSPYREENRWLNGITASINSSSWPMMGIARPANGHYSCPIFVTGVGSYGRSRRKVQCQGRGQAVRL